jgi:hypothetical protein
MISPYTFHGHRHGEVLAQDSLADLGIAVDDLRPETAIAPGHGMSFDNSAVRNLTYFDRIERVLDELPEHARQLYALIVRESWP